MNDFFAESLCVFIIEDDNDARSTLVDILELDTHTVCAHATASDAISDSRFGTADAVLLDRKLPDGLAEELLPRLKAVAQNAAFIVITGHADMSAAIAALREGVSDFLIKPIDADALRAGLTRLARTLSTERELYRQRRFAEKLLETAEAIILVLDPKGIVVRANPFLLDTTGYQLEEVIGVDWFERFIPKRLQAEVREVFEQTVNQMKTRGIVNPILTKDGTECEIRWSNSTLRDTKGETTEVLSVGLDVTDFMATQKRMMQNERLAAIGETMAGLAHESRNALQRIQNAVNLLQKRLTDDEVAIKDLGKIERGGKHIRDLLDEVRAYAAPIVLSRRANPIPPIWRRAWGSLQHRTKDCGAVLEEAVAEEFESRSVTLDERRLQQVFRNLFENALDAAERQPQITISVRTGDDDYVEICVRDNGLGVPESHRETLFDAFATSKPTGTGLGLAICRRIVEAHSGSIRLMDAVDPPGTEICIELPVA